jgi:hypothetical protein
MPSAPPVGTLFNVRIPVDFVLDGKIIARYLPDLNPYQVTLKNADFVGELIANGDAVVAGRVRPRHPAGVISVQENS